MRHKNEFFKLNTTLSDDPVTERAVVPEADAVVPVLAVRPADAAITVFLIESLKLL